MAISVTENHESREFTLSDDSDRVLVYSIVGTENELEVQEALLDASPAQYQGLSRWAVNAVPDGAAWVWKGTVTYRGAVWDPIDYPGAAPTLRDFAFDTGGGTQKVTQSMDTLIWDPVGGTPPSPDFHGAINVSEDSVEGVEIVVPRYEFQETHEFDPSFITQAYKMILFRATGRVNDADFKGFARGEVLFLGATGSRSGNETWRITFKFVCSPNEDTIDIGTDFIGLAKLGWEYLWVRYKDVEDLGAYSMVKRPTGVYTEQVYAFGDFSLLGIGVT